MIRPAPEQVQDEEWDVRMDRNIHAWGRTREARPPLRWRQVFILLNSIVTPCLEYPDSVSAMGGPFLWSNCNG